jgi:hypothetical protein
MHSKIHLCRHLLVHVVLHFHHGEEIHALLDLLPPFIVLLRVRLHLQHEESAVRAWSRGDHTPNSANRGRIYGRSHSTIRSSRASSTNWPIGILQRNQGIADLEQLPPHQEIRVSDTTCDAPWLPVASRQREVTPATMIVAALTHEGENDNRIWFRYFSQLRLIPDNAYIGFIFSTPWPVGLH